MSKIHFEGIHKSSQSPTSRRNEIKTRILERRMGQNVTYYPKFYISRHFSFALRYLSISCNHHFKWRHHLTATTINLIKVIHKIFNRSKFPPSKGDTLQNNVHNTWIHHTNRATEPAAVISSHQTPCYEDTHGKITLTRSLEQSIKSTKSKFKMKKTSQKHKSYIKSKCIRYNFFQNMRDLHLQQSHKYRRLKIISNSYKRALQNH